MNKTVHRKNAIRLLMLTAMVFIAIAFYLLVNSHPEKPKLFLNANLAFAVDLVTMGIVGTLIYWYLFKKTGHNVLYIMLIGTVLSSLFGSVQSAMIRVMDPNEYDALLSSLVADFNNVNGEIILFAVMMHHGRPLLTSIRSTCLFWIEALLPEHPGCAIIGHCNWERHQRWYPLISLV